MSVGRNYMFTVNFKDVLESDITLLDPSLWPCCSYAVYQLELGEQDVLHFQGYIELTARRSLRQLKEYDGLERAHFEIRRGSAEDANKYCQKQDTRIEGPFIYGERKRPGQRTDLEAVRQDIIVGASLTQVADTHFSLWCQYRGAFSDYKRLCTRARDFKSTTILVVGPSGIGKSRFAHTLLGYLGTHYKVSDKHTGFWCDDYGGEDTFFIDEFDGDRMRPKVFNEVCDRYECILPSHGSRGCQLVSKYILIVSNYIPKYWWKRRSAEQLHQTMRRIDFIIPLLRRSYPYCRCPQMCALHHN